MNGLSTLYIYLGMLRRAKWSDRKTGTRY